MHHNPLEQATAPSLLKAPRQAPSLIKLGACLVYEVLTLVALCFISALFFLWLAGDATHGVKRLLLQIFLWLSVGIYLVYCWVRSGQTLAMQAWRLKLVTQEGGPLNLNVAITRYLLASLSLLLCGLGFLWAIVDHNKLFLHDRLLKCRIVISTSEIV